MYKIIVKREVIKIWMVIAKYKNVIEYHKESVRKKSLWNKEKKKNVNEEKLLDKCRN